MPGRVPSLTLALAALGFCACPPCLTPSLPYAGSTVDPETLPHDPLEILELAADWSRDGTDLVDKLNALVALERAERAGADPFVTEVLRARACFRLVDENPDDEVRDAWVEIGLRAAEEAVRLRPERVEGHYFHGVMLGLWAERATVGALDALPRIEEVARTAVDIDPTYDDCGPLRLMGMLLVAAPPWPQSIGDAEYGVELLRESVACSSFPLNRIYLAEALFDAGETVEAAGILREVLSVPRRGRWARVGARWRPHVRELLDLIEHPGR